MDATAALRWASGRPQLERHSFDCASLAFVAHAATPLDRLIDKRTDRCGEAASSLSPTSQFEPYDIEAYDAT